VIDRGGVRDIPCLSYQWSLSEFLIVNACRHSLGALSLIVVLHTDTSRASLSSFCVHHGCILFVVEWRCRVECVDCFLCTRVHTLFKHTHTEKITLVTRVGSL